VIFGSLYFRVVTEGGVTFRYANSFPEITFAKRPPPSVTTQKYKLQKTESRWAGVEYR